MNVNNSLHLDIHTEPEDTGMEEVKIVAGTTLYFLAVIYFTESWLTQISILILSLIGLRL